MSGREHGRTGAPVLSPVLLGEAPSHAEYARTLVEQANKAALCTIALQPAGYPYGSLVNFALDAQACPLLLTSDLAEHTANFRADGRASLLVTESASGDPLAAGRVTLLGTVAPPADAEAAREAYLKRHPSARYYLDFSDFNFYCLRVEAIRYIGGFGRMSWVDVEAYQASRPDPVAPHAAAIITHMNEDHAAAMIELCRHFADVPASGASLVAVDRYGFEMNASTEQGPRRIRLPFPFELSSPDDSRRAFIEMLKEARAT